MLYYLLMTFLYDITHENCPFFLLIFKTKSYFIQKPNIGTKDKIYF